MGANQSAKSKAWSIFDQIVEIAAPGGEHSNPWTKDEKGALHYTPDYRTLELLLGVPLYLAAPIRSGVPALAIDVWISYELRRAGFDADQTWPRPKHPRILPVSVAKLLESLPKKEASNLRERIERTSAIREVTSSSATILGKNYRKQVDVIITDWATGPELLISTKRMDSSYGKNAPNRVEESYGDAKNLRLRHPLAALGFVFGLRSDILEREPATAEWLFDLLVKLGREDDAYHATALILMEYSGAVAVVDDGEEPPEDFSRGPGAEVDDDEALPADTIEDAGCGEYGVLEKLPAVKILLEKIPEALSPSRFLAAMVNRVLGATPVTMHKEARTRIGTARQAL